MTQENKGPSRRFLLGAIGAAALAKIVLPFHPKPSDIVVATEMPPFPGQANRRTVPEPEVELDRYLYDKRGNPVCVVTNIHINYGEIGVGADRHGFRESLPSPSRGEIVARLLPEAFVKDGDWKFKIG